MIRWIPYTFVRTVLVFIGGILLGFYFPDGVPENLTVGLILFLTLVYFFVALAGRRVRRLVDPGWIALPIVFLFGYAHLLYKTESRHKDHLSHVTGPITFYRAVITRFPEERERSWRTEARVTEIHSANWQHVEGNIILYFSRQDFSEPFQYGDVLLIRGQPQRPESPSNPGEFDYRRYLSLKNIYHQHFLRKGDVIKTDHAPPAYIMKVAYGGRSWAENTLEKFVDGPREQAIANALVLGVTDGLDNELLNAYSATGSMHILAVSGLHISIIYFILLWILSPLNRIPRGRWIVAFISLAILWSYALVTGLAPSVLRAVAMFSFFAIAKPWARSTNVYNTLAVSAFCLLILDPVLIFSVGFQLSYLAVLGIIYIYPRILRLWEPEYRLVTEAWKLGAVSVAAQIATFPLGLLYFHQFPNYFLLSNLLVVPLSFVVLVLGLVVLATSFAGVVASLLGLCLEYIIRLLNVIVFTMEDLPFSVIANVHISTVQCLLIMVLTLALIALLESKRFYYLILTFAVVVAFSALQWWHFLREVNVQKLAVYKVQGHTAMDLIDRGQTFFVADSALVTNSGKVNYHISPHRIMAGVRNIRSDPATVAFDGGRVIQWRGKTILFLERPGFETIHPLYVDMIVISNNAVPDLSTIAGINCRKVILDSSNTFFFASRFLEEAKLYKLDVHSVLHQGAFISTMENQDS